jgi:hypothetical protein
MLYTEDQIEELRQLPVRIEPHEAKHGGLYSAKQAQAAFGLFDQGKTPRACVTELALHPAAASALFDQYGKLDLGLTVSREMVQAMNRECIDFGLGPIRVAGDLMRIFTRAAASLEKQKPEAVCAVCKRARSVVVCRGCLRAAKSETGGPGGEPGPPAEISSRDDD